MGKVMLRGGSHETRADGMCAMEFVAWIANESHTETPTCADKLLSGFIAGINDELGKINRQKLKPYLGRCIGTAADGRGDERMKVYRSVDVEMRMPNAPEVMWSTAYDVGSDFAYKRRWADVRDVLDRLLPTVELPEVTAAIREKVGAEA